MARKGVDEQTNSTLSFSPLRNFGIAGTKRHSHFKHLSIKPSQAIKATNHRKRIIRFFIILHPLHISSILSISSLSKARMYFSTHSRSCLRFEGRAAHVHSLFFYYCIHWILCIIPLSHTSSVTKGSLLLSFAVVFSKLFFVLIFVQYDMPPSFWRTAHGE